jgi:geranylgeranyl pyrophosphate synthase
VTVLASIREAPGLGSYLDELEEQLQETVASHPGIVAAVGADALAAGGKRRRPMRPVAWPAAAGWPA